MKQKFYYKHGVDNIFDIIDSLPDGNEISTIGCYLEDNTNLSADEFVRLRQYHDDDFINKSTNKVILGSDFFKIYNIKRI